MGSASQIAPLPATPSPTKRRRKQPKTPPYYGMVKKAKATPEAGGISEADATDVAGNLDGRRRLFADLST